MTERRVDIRVSILDDDANKRLDALKAKLDKVTGDFKIRLKLDDGGASVMLDKISAKLDKISKKDFSPKLKMDGITKADAELDKFNAKLDRISHRRVRATVSVDTKLDLKHDLSRAGGMLGPLFGGGGGGGGLTKDAEEVAGGGGGKSHIGSGLLSSLGGASNAYTGAAIGGLIALAASILPVIGPLALGLGAGGLGGFGAFKLDPKAFKDVAKDAESSFLTSLQGLAPGAHSGGNRGGGQPGTSFLEGIVKILNQLSGFITRIGPGLGTMFRASLPIMMMFTKSLETMVKLLLPAFTQSMKALTPVLPTLEQGFKFLSQGVADFIKDLGPGTQNAAVVFKTVMLAVKGILIGLAYFSDGLATAFRGIGFMAGKVSHAVRDYWDRLRHDTDDSFTQIRHDIAHIWDTIFQDTIGALIRFNASVTAKINQLDHNIENAFDQLRHDAASIWDNIWHGTVSTVARLYHDVLAWFDRLPSAIGNALGKLGSMLKNIGSTALNDFLDGLKSVGSNILSWIKNFIGGIPHDLMKLLHMSPPHPGSVFFDLGANFMKHLEAGMKSHVASIGGGGGGGFAGHLGGSVSSWIVAALRASGKPMSWLPALSRLVSLESGGNPRAVDPISVDGEHAEGLWQMLPSTFFGAGGRGSIFNPIEEGIAALRYISGRYGSPFNIPGLFNGGYQGYAAGGAITEPILGMGLHTGMTYGFGENAPASPEYVVPGGRGGGGTIVNNFYLLDDSNPDASALRVIKKIRQYKGRHGNNALGIA